MAIPPLRILLLSDGKPGHYHQAEGIVAALARLRPVVTTRIEVRPRRLVPQRILQHLVNIGAPPETILSLGYGLTSTLPPCHLVVSAGGNTLAANAAAATLTGAFNIFCGRVRRLAPHQVTLISVLLPDYATLPNHFVCHPPSPFHPRPACRPFEYGPNNPPNIVGLLVGGNSKPVRFGGGDWDTLLSFIRQCHIHYGIRWIITTSRRSPNHVGNALAHMRKDPSNGIACFIDYRNSMPGAPAQVFSGSDAIVCTDDSTTMIAQAVSARLPLVSLTPNPLSFTGLEAQFRSHLARNGWYRQIRFQALSPLAFLQTLETITPKTTDPKAELAHDLAIRLPHLFAHQHPHRNHFTPTSPAPEHALTAL